MIPGTHTIDIEDAIDACRVRNEQTLPFARCEIQDGSLTNKELGIYAQGY